jgi:hypothetical protein
MTTVGFIGSGNIGSAVARLAIAAGRQVVFSNSRGPDALAAMVAELGPLARAATPADAAAAVGIAVVAIPLRAYRAVPAAPLTGKMVIDAGNYYPPRDGQIAELDSGSVTSSELLREHLPGARVVKAFNDIAAGTCGRWAVPPGRPITATCRSPATTPAPRRRSPRCWTRSAVASSTPAGSPTDDARKSAPRSSSRPTDHPAAPARPRARPPSGPRSPRPPAEPPRRRQRLTPRPPGQVPPGRWPYHMAQPIAISHASKPRT